MRSLTLGSHPSKSPLGTPSGPKSVTPRSLQRLWVSNSGEECETPSLYVTIIIFTSPSHPSMLRVIYTSTASSLVLLTMLLHLVFCSQTRIHSFLNRVLSCLSCFFLHPFSLPGAFWILTVYLNYPWLFLLLILWGVWWFQLLHPGCPWYKGQCQSQAVRGSPRAMALSIWSQVHCIEITWHTC